MKRFMIGMLGLMVLFSAMGFTAEPPALAQVKKGKDGQPVFVHISAAKLVKKSISNGYLRLVKIDFTRVDGKFYLVREVKGKKGEHGYLFSQVSFKKGKLYPIKVPELYWPCWQIASCQCDRPSRYADCKCSTGGSGCTNDFGGTLHDPFKDIWAWP
ncbi:MAG: hypothetical protein AAFR61_02835 [Bacteroidota bacterium]